MDNHKYLNDKLYVLLNKCAHRVIGFESYRMNTSTFLSKLNWLSFYQMVIAGSLKTVHKMVINNEPIALTNYLYNSNSRENMNRIGKNIALSRERKSIKTKNSFLNRSIIIYNSLKIHIVALDHKIFKSRIKGYIWSNFAFNNIPNIT